MKNTGYINRIRTKLRYLGLNVNPVVFIGMRFIVTVLLFLVLLFSVPRGYIVAPLVTLIYYVMLEYFILDRGISNRSKELEDDALEFFPIFLLALKGGRNIKNAINVTTLIINNSLSHEFEIVLKDISIGKSLEEALTLLKDRMPSSIIRNIIVLLIETNRLGNSLNDSINIQLDYIKEKRKKKILNKFKIVPYKLALVSLIFVFMILIILIAFSYYL